MTTHYKLDMDEAGRSEHSRWYVQLWEKISLKNAKLEKDEEKTNHSLKEVVPSGSAEQAGIGNEANLDGVGELQTANGNSRMTSSG